MPHVGRRGEHSYGVEDPIVQPHWPYNQPFQNANNSATLGHAAACFPEPWTVELMPCGYRVLDANGIVLAHVYGQPDGSTAVSDSPLTNDEARRISKLIYDSPTHI